MSTSVRVARRGRGIKLILIGAAAILTSGAVLTALLAIAFTATGNLAVAATHRPNAIDAWRQAGQGFEPRRQKVVARDVAASVSADRNRWDEAFGDTEAAGQGRAALAAKLAASSLTTGPAITATANASLVASAEPVAAEAQLRQAPREISPVQPVQLASLTPPTRPVEIATPREEPVAEADDVVEEPEVAEPLRIVPIPKPRPADFARLAQTPARPSRAQVVPVSLETAEPETARQASRPTALAYANPGIEPKSEGPGAFFRGLLDQDAGVQLPHRSKGIAIYDIASATVRLPNGERLEAHSGLGHRQDDARYVREKNRGPTPPNIYDLRMREARFHGSEAIRLLPRSAKLVFNRDGLLAHPYMYAGGGSRSQSNGCVVFKDYSRFLRAFKAGEIAKLVVVPNMAELPTYMAGL